MSSMLEHSFGNLHCNQVVFTLNIKVSHLSALDRLSNLQAGRIWQSLLGPEKRISLCLQ